MPTGRGWLDEQHRQIFERTDQLMNAMKDNEGKSVVKELIEFLGDFVATALKKGIACCRIAAMIAKCGGVS